MSFLQSLFAMVGVLVEPCSNDLPIPSPYVHDQDTITLCDPTLVNKYTLHTMQLVVGGTVDCPPPPVDCLPPSTIEAAIFGILDLTVFPVILLTLLALGTTSILYLTMANKGLGGSHGPTTELDADQDVATHSMIPRNESTGKYQCTLFTEDHRPQSWKAHVTAEPDAMRIFEYFKLARKEAGKGKKARPCKSYRNRVKKRAAKALEAAMAAGDDLAPSNSQTVPAAFKFKSEPSP